MTKCSKCGGVYGNYAHYFQSGTCPPCARNDNFLKELEKIFERFIIKIREALP